MPNDGIYLSNDTYQKFLGDTFEQDSRSTIADEWQRQATAAIPSMVADAQDRQQQAQRNSMADQFLASVPDIAAQHVATLKGPESLPNGLSVVPTAEPSQSATVAPDTAPAMGQAGVVDTSAPSPQTPAVPTVSPPATGYEAAARAAAQKYGIDPDLFARQISQESGFNPNAQSPAGARGIAQFMPDTARGLGVNPDDPEQALDGAARYMAQLIQHNGGDVSKALAAYNAGQGNVDKYGGIPPFEETKRYVDNIMGGAGQVAASVGSAIANSGAGRVVTAAVNNVIGALRPSQFGVGLSDAEAYAACGPVAAMAFARATGQNPTAEQAVALAKQLGWTPAHGMAGPGSELDLLKNMGVPAHMEQAADPAKIAQDVQNGNPVIISTPGHYFVADGYDPQKGFHVGSSGTDLKAGSEWMSLDQMQRVMGAAQATLYLDRKPGDGPSVAAQMSQSDQTTDQVAANTSTPAQPQSMWDKLGSGISDVFKNIFGGVPGAGSGAGGTDYSTSPSPQDATLPAALTQASQSGQANLAAKGIDLNQPIEFPVSGVGPSTRMDLGNAISQAGASSNMPVVGGALQAAGGMIGAPSVLEQIGTLTSLESKYGGGIQPDGKWHAPNYANITPADEQALSGAMMVVGGLVGDVGAKYDPFGVQEGFTPPAAKPGAIPETVRPTYGDAAMLEPEIAATLPQPPAPQEASTTLQGLLGMAKARGVDTSAFEAQLPKSAAIETPAVPSPTEGPLGLKPVTAEPPAAPPALPPSPPPTAGGVGDNLPGIPPPVPGKASLADVFRSYHTGNVVSGLATLTHVALNSIVSPAWSFATRGAADVLGGNLDRAAGSGIGLSAGLADSGRAIAQAFSDHFSNPHAIFNQTLPGPLNSGVAKLFFKAQAVPTALHALGQTFAQNAITKMELGRLAGEEASNAGLTGQAWTNHVAGAINNPATSMLVAAEGTAKRAALRGDPGTLGQIMQQIASAPFVGNTLFPVVRIATNALSQGIEKSPLGLLGTGLDVARATVGKSGPYASGFAGNGIVSPLSERLTNNIAGTALTAWLATKALDGSITGDGPADPGQKAELMAQGWQPNSVYVPGRGYVDFHALGPLADDFALAGSYGDAVKYGGAKGGTTNDAGVIADSMFKQMGKYLEDATGMRTIGQLYDIFHTQGLGLTSAAKAGAQFGSQLVGGFVPESALVRGIATATDPNARKAAASAGDLASLFGQGLSMGIPGLREQNVPVRQNLWGEPDVNNQAGLGVFSPRTGTGSPDPNIKALMDAGVKFPVLPTQVSVSSKYAIDLTSEEKQQFQTLRGQIVRDALNELVADPSFSEAPIATRQRYLQRLFAQADKAASRQLVEQIPDAQLVDRVLANQDKRAPVAVASP